MFKERSVYIPYYVVGGEQKMMSVNGRQCDSRVMRVHLREYVRTCNIIVGA